MSAKLLTAIALLASALVAHAQGCPQGSAALTGAGLQAANGRADVLFRHLVLRPDSVAAPVPQRPAAFVDAAAHGVRADGLADDTQALQSALDEGRQVWLQPGGVYRISRRLDLQGGMALLSDGSATLLMAARGLDNVVAKRTPSTLYSKRGVALSVQGEGALLQGFFIVKEWVEDHYVVAVDIHEASHVIVRGLRLRGFSTAPGIITVRSASEVEISDTLIHDSCSASTQVPEDVASLQITGISVDDSRVGGRGSTRLRILNNVIVDLRMLARTPRGNQTDGIHFAAIGSGAGSLIAGNHIDDVDEGVDLFGSAIRVVGNRIRAQSLAVKLIHGASQIELLDNELQTGTLGAVALYSARPPLPERQVRDVLIQRNRLRVNGQTAIHIDAQQPWAPTGVVLRANRYELADCASARPSCVAPQCQSADEQRVLAPGFEVCPALVSQQ